MYKKAMHVPLDAFLRCVYLHDKDVRVLHSIVGGLLGWR